ncbi:CfaE/CblD family pilus tip adhesin [Rahnella perminowiae]|uniref:Pilus assembly protein CblD n=1 Tax=Rahnella perminowiae TaxID=2816244 RepID=A0ABS6L884_9GAMM|nr:CfaE/CblD family pilus tip adhesin [Rahnella perminowiae]MBU9838051.1 pilus assembly protein CblD [Rahnella perminowiae]MCR9000139.1 pilus assembly protein CblD [Rahnella perminowiae]
MKLTTCLTSLLLLLSTSLLTMPDAHAERVEPTGRDTPVIATFDKSSLPSQVDIWHHESGGHDPDNPDEWGHNNWVCLSSSSAEYGACPTTSTWNDNGTTLLPLIFTEQRSHMSVTLNLQGYHSVQITSGGGCGEMGTKLVNAATTSSCSGRAGDEALLYISIPPDELAKIPAGGIWQADLKMSLMQWVKQSGPSNKLADWHARITLNVTDNNNQQIYLPEFGQAAPRVDLNMRPLPGTGGKQAQMNGAANIDMCLYDGYGSNSTSFTLKFDDQQQGTTQRNNGYFSIYSDHGDVNQDSGRIDYYVKMQAPDGKYVSIIRGEDLVIPNIQTARVRPVHLPGIPQAVLCIPAPLELSTKTLDINSKQAGHYTGHLIVNFTSQL